MPSNASKGMVRYCESFATDNIHTSQTNGVAWLVLGDTNDTVFGRAVAAGRGLHAKAITAATNNNMIEFCGDTLQFYAQEGQNAVEVLIQLTDVTNRAFAFGFNDDSLDASNSLPVELSTTTFTANAGTFCGLVYDTDATNDELHAFWVDGGTATTTAIADLRFNGIAPTNSQWLWMRVELHDRGSGNGAKAVFHVVDHNGRSATKEFNTTITRSTALCYYLGVENRSASSCTIYIKEPAWEQPV